MHLLADSTFQQDRSALSPAERRSQLAPSCSDPRGGRRVSDMGPLEIASLTAPAGREEHCKKEQGRSGVALTGRVDSPRGCRHRCGGASPADFGTLAARTHARCVWAPRGSPSLSIACPRLCRRAATARRLRCGQAGAKQSVV